jgi:hypothetical protein
MSPHIGKEDTMESTRFLDDIDSSVKGQSETEYVRPKRTSYGSAMLHGSLITFYSILFLFATFKNRHTITNHDTVLNMIQCMYIIRRL